MTFEEWRETLTEEEKDDLIEECRQCDGAGEHECEYCNSITTCDECGGAGEHDNSMYLYRECIKKDGALWERYHI